MLEKFKIEEVKEAVQNTVQNIKQNIVSQNEPKQPRIAVLIPCYNEALTIGKVVSDFKQELPEADIYVYDNNSTDRTSLIAQEAGAIVRCERQQGKGNVIRRMFREIDADCYLMVDGDDTYPASSAREMVNLVLNQNIDMVIGDRLSSTYFTENKRPFHNMGNTLVRKTINALFHTDIKDVMTGYRAMSYNFIKTFPVISQGFEIETEMTIHAVDKHMSTKNVIIKYKDRPQGSVSKLNTYSDGFKVIRMIFNLYKTYKPLSFFSSIAGVLTIIASCFFIPVLLEFAETGLVEKFPTLIVCGFTYIGALLSFFAGLILETVQNQNRKDFEYKLVCVDTYKRNSNKG